MTEESPTVAQSLIGDVSRSMWDAIVVGAGPAGGAAAALLASQGAAVLLVDRAKFPREKVCGDGLVPEAMDALRKIGLVEQVRACARTLPGYVLVGPSGSSAERDVEISMLPRRTLDALIAAKAVANGAVFAQARF